MAASVPEDRRGRCTIALGIQRLSLARARNDLRAVAEEAQRLLASTEATEFGLGEDVRTSVLTDLGIAETWAGRLEDAERHLAQGLEEARRISKPMLELQALANWALLSSFHHSLATAEQRATQAIGLARKHGWEETAPAAATAYVVLVHATVWRGRLREAESWLDLAERVLERDTQPTPALMLYATRAWVEGARSRPHRCSLGSVLDMLRCGGDATACVTAGVGGQPPSNARGGRPAGGSTASPSTVSAKPPRRALSVGDERMVARADLPRRLDPVRWRGEFVGPADAFARLHAAGAGVQDGGVAFAVVVGDAGIGKSHLPRASRRRSMRPGQPSWPAWPRRTAYTLWADLRCA